jgi:hypothetical protein
MTTPGDILEAPESLASQRVAASSLYAEAATIPGGDAMRGVDTSQGHQ